MKQSLKHFLLFGLLVGSLACSGGGDTGKNNREELMPAAGETVDKDDRLKEKLKKLPQKSYKKDSVHRISKKDKVNSLKLSARKLKSYFPESKEKLELKFKEEQQGYVLAQLKTKDRVLTLSIRDLLGERSKIQAYMKLKTQFKNYPFKSDSKTGSLLLKRRFEIQVKSVDGKGLSERYQKKYLEWFRLSKLQAEKTSIMSKSKPVPFQLKTKKD